MKIKTNSKWILAALVPFMAFVVSCGGDEEEKVPAPVADFSSSVDGKTVTFTDASTDATTYAWDFGDGNSSTQPSPTHTYDANGSYIVKLTVTNETGEDSKQEVFEIINVVIDGDFSEWADIPAINLGGGTVTLMKLENLDNNKLYIYVEGTADMTDLAQVMLNLDNDRTTGAMIDWLYVEAGEDVLIEGNLPAGDEQYGSIFPCAPCDGSSPGNWNWGSSLTDNIADFLVASAMTDVAGGKAYEMAIDLTAMGSTISSEAIGVGVLDISLDTWGPVGAVPALYNENDNPDATLHMYTFK